MAGGGCTVGGVLKLSGAMALTSSGFSGNLRSFINIFNMNIVLKASAMQFQQVVMDPSLGRSGEEMLPLSLDFPSLFFQQLWVQDPWQEASE